MFVSCDSNNLRWFAANVSNSYQGQLTHSVALFIGSLPPSHQIRDLSPHLQDPADAFRPLALLIHIPGSLQTHEVLLQLEVSFSFFSHCLLEHVHPLPIHTASSWNDFSDTSICTACSALCRPIVFNVFNVVLGTGAYILFIPPDFKEVLVIDCFSF